VFLVTTLGLRVYLTWITATGYTYGALATPIAFLLFAFFLGFAIMIGAELNAAVQEEWPAPVTHAHRLRGWIEEQAEALKDDSAGPAKAAPSRDRPDPAEDAAPVSPRPVRTEAPEPGPTART
jgi:membrane protein